MAGTLTKDYIDETIDKLDEVGLGLPEPTEQAKREALQKLRKRGRPLGSRNKMQSFAVNWLLSQYRDPRAVLMEAAGTPIDEMVLTMGCTPLEALDAKIRAAIGVLPYIAQKQPLSVDLTRTTAVRLTIVEAGVESGAVSQSDIVKVIEHVSSQESQADTQATEGDQAQDVVSKD